MRKILSACALLLLCAVSAAGEGYDIAGLWNIGGTGFAEKNFLRISLALDGNMTLTTATTNEVLNNAVSSDIVRQAYPESEDILSGDLRFLTAYDINLEITATNLDISAWSDHIPNGIRIPVPLPARVPTADYPLEIPVQVVNDGLRYTLTLTSSSSGKVRVQGYVDLDVVGSTEINADSAVWKYGTQRPSYESETSSGCDSGFGALMLLLVFAGVKKIVRD